MRLKESFSRIGSIPDIKRLGVESDRECAKSVPALEIWTLSSMFETDQSNRRRRLSFLHL
jgi:hypothetical protein